MKVIEIGMIGTVALASLLLFLGYGIQRRIGFLSRLNIPPPVIGGLCAALALLIARLSGLPPVEFDATLRTPLMVAFFTSIGFAASYRLLRVSGVLVVVLLILTSAFAIVQSFVGMGVATLFGLHPLIGVLTGAVSLTGGPATSLAFAPAFEAAGVAGAAPIALATAMAGIILGGLVGAPVATLLIQRHGLRGNGAPQPAPSANEVVPALAERRGATVPPADDSFVALKALAVVLVAMWLGAQLSGMIERLGVTLPAYVGAMLVAAALRNIDDLAPLIRLPHRSIETAGNVALSLFLVMALMSIDLLALADLALPLIVNLTLQVVLAAAVCFWPIYRLMGRDYDSAVTCGGFVGFMLGTTANAMAVMRSVVERFGAAPRAFLVAPVVGTFLLDFTNAIIITLFLNFFA